MILNKKVKPNMEVALGKETEKGLMIKDLAKASPILISGESGTGKTTLMKHIIMQLIQYNYEDELRLSLVEGRDSNFKQFANLPHLLDDIIKNKNLLYEHLSSLNQEINDRKNLFNEYNQHNIDSFNESVVLEKINRNKLPYIVLMIDDFKPFAKSKTIIKLLDTLIEKGATYGIHVIISTKSLSKKDLPFVIRNDFKTSITYRVENGVKSKFILSSREAVELSPHHFFYKSNNETLSNEVIAQCVDDRDIDALIKRELGNQADDVVKEDESKQDEVQPIKLHRKEDANMKIGLGYSKENGLITVDIKKLPHLLISGVTGSGKSVVEDLILTQLIDYNAPENLKLSLFDPKGNEFCRYKDSKHLLHKPMVDIDESIEKLEELVKISEKRFQEMANHNTLKGLSIKDIKSFNEMVDAGTIDAEKMPYIVVMIDEIMPYMGTDLERTVNAIRHLTMKSRASGIHLILSTQSPRREVVNGVIKANIDARLSLMVSNMSESVNMIGETGAEKLKPHGDFILKTEDGTQRGQAYYIDDSKIQSIIKQ